MSGDIKQAYGRVEKVIYSTDTTTEYFISNAEQGVKGQGQFLQSGGWKDFSYDCTVNIRNGTVAQSEYKLS
ncbi:MAG: hypothetical protein HC825_03900 [Oscillatoriales cyanobacterium RM1_1_9]|nr:hypothetical protein [Oscillatoriales cyanobacterium SM2_3_0]NJO44874.1 hypothetical protein [Oscillatoriales cyanobacterium RM2_1_1]NJO71068.1 hypothetical protein [Oscillatoriales cyanobacterium RM1_1_9]